MPENWHKPIVMVSWLCFCLAGLPVLGQKEDPASLTTPGSQVPREVTVTERGTVRLHVADLPLSTVLHLLSLEGERNIIASPGVTGSVTANLYDVSFEEALKAILVTNGAGYRIEGNFIYVHTFEELAKLEAARRPPPITRVYRLNYVSSADAKAYIGGIVGEESGTISIPPAPSVGLQSAPDEGGGASNAAQDFIIVTARIEIHASVAALLREIDVRPKQVLIEATILRAELGEDNALGIDFTLLGGVDLELMSATSNGLIDLTLGQLPQNRLEDTNAIATTGFTGTLPTGGLRVGIIQDQVALFLTALEEVTNTTVLANPKVLALNRQKAQVIVGRRDGFFTTTVTETAAIQTVEFLETGTQLIFRPFIGDDGFVRVELHPEDSVGFVNAQGLPSEQTTSVTTNVIVRDGETILIGGLFRDVTTATRSQIPALGNLPVIGALFRSNTDSVSREEIIILLTIHIVKDREAYASASMEEYDHMRKIQLGVRKGLMWHGRERLSQTHYRKAVEEYAAKKNKAALWHVNMALHIQPGNYSAIQLKEKIVGQPEWSPHLTGDRSFLHFLIERELGYDLSAP